jgi:hypothetical protein
MGITGHSQFFRSGLILIDEERVLKVLRENYYLEANGVKVSWQSEKS